MTSGLSRALAPYPRSDVRDLLRPADLLEGLLAAERLRRDAVEGRLTAAVVEDLHRLVAEDADALVRAGAVRVLSGCLGPVTDRVLLHALADPDAGVVERAAWGFALRPMVVPAIRPLLRLVEQGHFAGVLATATLERWGAAGGWRLSREIRMILGGADPEARPRLVELLGLCGDAAGTRRLLAVTHDATETPAVRAAAAAALGRCSGQPVVRALHDREQGDGLTVAQVMLQGHVDAELTAAGSGDSGGLVTLVGNLARELAEQPGVRRVLTLARDRQGREAGPGDGREDFGPRSVLVRAEFGEPGPLAAPRLWSLRVEIEAELTRLLVAAPDVDVVHLRATDGGAWAAMRVCRALGIPYVFTVAPDPHAVIAAAQRSGLTRAMFAAADAAEHWWFRIALLEDLVAGAAALAVFPRPGGIGRLSELVGIDLDALAPTVVPEGASLRAPQAAAATMREVADGADLPPVLGDLVAAVTALGPARQGLPLLVTAGRLHPVKGVDRLVDAWAGDADLRAAFNLVVVGGELGQPSPVERGVLDAIRDRLDEHPGEDGLVLLGARPHQQLALVLAAAQAGLGATVGSDGVYVCASVKEEFGLAIVEALAAGLTVVAPDDGGPPTYVHDGVTGVLVDAGSLTGLRAGIAHAAVLRLVAGRADRARHQITDEVSLAAMAGALAEVYAGAVQP